MDEVQKLISLYLKDSACSVVPVISNAKVAPEGKALRSLFPIRAMYEREAFYYQRVFPEFERMPDAFRSYPKFHEAHMEDGKELFILEDVTELGFTMRDRLESLDYQHSALVIREYARLHGTSYALKMLKPKLFEELRKEAEDKVFKGLSMSELREKSLKERVDRALGSLNADEHRDAYERFLKFSEKMFYSVKNMVRAEAAGDYAVFTHSDSWICNYMFKYQDGEPVKLRVLDWQLARCGSPVLDLSYFFFCCTDRDLRRSHYDSLLGLYYSTLSSYLREFDLDVENVLPWSVLEEHLVKFSGYGMYMATWVLNLSLLQGGTLPSMENASSEKDLLRLRQVKGSEDLELYNVRMRSAILDFIEYGYDVISD